MRVSELAMLALDVTKSASEMDQFDAELQQLRRQLSSLGSGNFNGITLFVQSATGATAASMTDELLDPGVTVNGNSMSISKPVLAASAWVDMLINGFVSFADPSDATRGAAA
jgi:flagellin-like hook-associated protein FlgL